MRVIINYKTVNRYGFLKNVDTYMFSKIFADLCVAKSKYLQFSKMVSIINSKIFAILLTKMSASISYKNDSNSICSKLLLLFFQTCWQLYFHKS